MKDWQEEYERKSVSPDEAVKCVTSGNTVVIPIDSEVKALSSALIRRCNELENVRVLIRSPRVDLGWLERDLRPAFDVLIDTQAGTASRALNEKKADFIPFLTSLRFKGEDHVHHILEDIDVVMAVVSPPDKNGFCSFGPYLSHKRDYVRKAKKVLAEVDKAPHMRVKMFGDNYIHISEIDYFVEHVPVSKNPTPQQKIGREERSITEYVATLIEDGDTIQLGPGSITSSIPVLGGFDGKHDLGCHSALLGSELLKLIRDGVMNGMRKNINRGKAVSGGVVGIENEEDLRFIDENPLLEVRDMSYVNDIRVISSHDRMVAINSVLAVDLAGQLAADSLGAQMYGGAGGQVDFVIGAALSKGGCSITALRSTASHGTISRIVPTLEERTVVSIPLTFADYVVTENGIARLWGKSRKQRAQELIAVAHPDFQPELRKQAEKLF